MKIKKFGVLVMTLVLASGMMAGCGGGTGENGANGGTDDAAAAFMEFLNGNGTVTAGDYFNEDDEYGDSDGLSAGEYTYDELKNALIDCGTLSSEESIPTCRTRYIISDFGGDGVNEMVLRFESDDYLDMNWNGTVYYDGEKLNLMYCQIDGYRSFSEWYDSGYNVYGGSGGAGAYIRSVYKFDDKAEPHDVYTWGTYFSSFASEILYDMQNYDLITGEELDELEGTFSLPGDSEINLEEIIKDGTIYVVASDRSSDESVYAAEEKFLNALVEKGVKIIGDEEFEELIKFTDSEESLKWTLFYDGSAPVISVEYDTYYDADVNSEFNRYETPGSEYSEFVVDALITPAADITDVKILKITYNEDVSDKEGTSYFDSEVLETYEMLPQEEPFFFTYESNGDIPGYGISFKYGDDEFAYAIIVSGMDGDLELSEVSLT